MDRSSDETVTLLNNLIKTCADGTKNFQQASNDIDSLTLKSLLTRYSQQRAQFVSDLGAEVRRLGGKAEISAGQSGTVYRGWANRKTKIGGGHNAILPECEINEEATKKLYENVLASAVLPKEVRSLVEEQYKELCESLETIRSFEADKLAAQKKPT